MLQYVMNKNLKSQELFNSLPSSLLELSEIFKSHNKTLFLVGGYLRDFLLGIYPIDIDICSSVTLPELEELLKTTNFKFEIKNKTFGTALITTKNISFEYTVLRTETYELSGKHSPNCVTFVSDIMSDSKRRDFYVNALYFDISNKQILDPTNCGLVDISKKQIRVIERTPNAFNEDSCRILRLIKYAITKDLKIEEQTFNLAKKHIHLTENISCERIKKENSYLFNNTNFQNAYKKILSDLFFPETVNKKLLNF